MKAYVGLTRDPKLRDKLVRQDVGVVLLTEDISREIAVTIRASVPHPGEFSFARSHIAPPDIQTSVKRLEKVLVSWPSWFLDNGAFSAWKQTRPLDLVAWYSAVLFLVSLHNASRREMLPDFVVLPDIVAGGIDSLHFSAESLQMMELDGINRIVDFALVVQEGMDPAHFPWELPFQVLFVGGGALEWKFGTAEAWVEGAHAHGKRCHVGRVGTEKRVLFAREIGIDSIDSSLPLFSRDQTTRFLRALRAPLSGRLFPSSATPR